MTTLELFKKHRKGEVSRERFLYEVRRDNNLPWITNVTSYNDAVKILKNKGIIREAYENVATDPAVDRVNPYYLKKGVQKSIANEKELKDDTYINHLNKAAKKLQSDPKAFHGEMFGNYDTVNKADSKLQMTPVKKDNFVDEDNGMKKVKGQEAPKAMSAPTKENRKGKPKDVKVMPDKGVEGKEKVIKEVTALLKKKLAENSMYHEYHVGMEVETPKGTGIVKEINGGTLTVETKDGKLMDVQMNTASHFTKKKKEESQKTFSEAENKIHKIQVQVFSKDENDTLDKITNDALKPLNLNLSLKDKVEVQSDAATYPKVIVMKFSDEEAAEAVMDSLDEYDFGAIHNLRGEWPNAESDWVDDMDSYKQSDEQSEEEEDEFDKYDDEDWFPANVDESFENQSTLRGGLKPYHDPTSQLTGTGKPNVTGPMPTDDLDNETELQPGDRVKVVYGNQFYGMTGTIEDVMRGFVIVNIDEDGEDYSMHSSDVEKIGEEDDLEEASYAGKGSITAFKKDPKYSALSGPTRVEMEKKLNAGGSVEL